MAEPAIKADHKVKVFISYSRRDRAFAERIVAALEARGLEPKLDTRDLPKLEDWRRELLGFIREADAVVFIVSPNSAKSAVCSWEVEQVATLSKRLAPIVLEPVPDDRIPEAISKINYLFFDPPNDFEVQASALADALQTDLEWVKNHTRLGELAHRWDERGRRAGLTLRGQELLEAERWIASRPRGAPEPTAVHKSFVSESRRVATRRLRLSVAGSLAVGIFAVALAVFAFFQQRAAEASRANAIKVLATSDFQRGTGLLQNDETVSEGVASLARAVRRGQDKRALTRLWTLLQQRDFWFPTSYQDRLENLASIQTEPEPVPEDIKQRFGKLSFNGAVVDTEFISLSGNKSRVFTSIGSVANDVDVRYRIWHPDGTPVTDWLAPEYKGNTYAYQAKGSLSFDGRYLALEIVGWRETAYLEIYDLQANKRIGGPIEATGLQPNYQNVTFSHIQFAQRPPSASGEDQGMLLLAASAKGDAAVYQIADDRVDLLTRNRHAEPVVFAALDVANEWLMSSSSDGTLRASSVSEGVPVGNVLQLPNAAITIARDAGDNLSVTYGSGERRSFSLHRAARFPLPADLQIKDKRTACKRWGDDTVSPGAPDEKTLNTPRGELTRLGPRQLAIGKPGEPQTTSSFFSADVVLVCLNEAADRFAVTTSDFVTEVWALDFSKRLGLPIVERRLFGTRTTPATTAMTMLSPDGKSATVESFLFDPPNVNRYWYSFWDLDTALPLMDRIPFGDDSLTKGVVESVRMDSTGRDLVFVNESDEKKAVPVSSLQVTAPESVGSWIADFVEAIAGVSLDDEGALVPVPDRLERLQQGSEKLAGLSAGSGAGK